MVKYRSRLDSTFDALAHPARRQILARLAKSQASVGELASPLRMSLPAVSKHLRVLRGAGLLRQRRRGRVRTCRLDSRPLKHAAEWIERYRKFWDAQLDALERFLKEDETTSSNEKETER